ncbi:hypothetical protein [Nocardioides sambongensis]|uniref:hypothetical protein n=1 Tax=Nocardioides sambongensis TaxID=2589074 RepID=UPI00112810FD|nr:hypothetical protein [Nocardioides sambongensis]
MWRRRRRVRPLAVDPASGEVVSPLPFVALVLLASSFFLNAASGVIAPWWVVVLLLVVWAGLLLSCLRAWTEDPPRTVRIGIASIVVWAVVVIGGGIAFGWSG